MNGRNYISLRLTDDQLAVLEDLCRQLECNRSQALRIAMLKLAKRKDLVDTLGPNTIWTSREE